MTEKEKMLRQMLYDANNDTDLIEERLAMLKHYVPVLDNWAVCDSYCAHAKWMMRADKAALWAFLERWFDSEHEFEVRFAVGTLPAADFYRVGIS